MRVRFTKNPPAAGNDVLACERPDGTATSLEMPRQGILPRAAIHFVVEATLGLRDALFGHVARGESVDRAISPSIDSEEAQQTAALVECLQAELAAGASDYATFSRTLAAKCRQRRITAPALSPEELERLRVALREFGAAWRPLAPGRSLERTFPP